MDNTSDYFQTFVFLESFFCINRCYLIKNKIIKFICILIFITSSSVVIGSIMYEFFILGIDIDIKRNPIYIISGLELIYLAFDARIPNSFNALRKLDEKCVVDTKVAAKVKVKARLLTMGLFFSALLNFGVALAQDANLSRVLLFGVATTVHDAELDLISSLIEGINLRLETLKESSPVIGTKVYRNVLITVSHMREDVNNRILLIMAVTLLETVIYVVFVLLIDSDTWIATLFVWRQLRSVSSLWFFCLTAYGTKCVCEGLAIHLAKKLVLDSVSKREGNRHQYDITSRWYESVLREKPRYTSGAVECIDLTIPLHLFDVGVNYLIIILQVYAAYN